MYSRLIGISVLIGCGLAIVPSARLAPLAPPASPAPLAAPAPLPPLSVVVERHTVIGVRLDHDVSTQTARVADRVSATVTREVDVAGREVIPVGTRLAGVVAAVHPRLGLHFDTMTLTDGTRLSIATETIHRGSVSAPAGDATRVDPNAVAGTILGGVLGGTSGESTDVALREGALLTVRLTADLVVQVMR